MKLETKLAAYIAVGIFLWSPSAQSQSLSQEAVLARAVGALGGRSAWADIECMKVSGHHTSFSRTRTFLMRRCQPNLYRLDHNEGSRDLIEAYDGELAWWQTVITMVSKANWPVETPVAHTRAIRADAELVPPLVAGGDRGHDIRVLGERELDGEVFYEVEITLGSGGMEKWYLDTDTFLPAARLSTGAYHGVAAEQRTYYSDYRKVDGVLLPYHVEIELGNDFLVLDVDKVEINAQIDRKVFAMPLPAGMEPLQDLAGTWDVEIRTPAIPGRPLLKTRATSVIEGLQRGAILEERISYISGGFAWNVEKFLSYDRFRRVYRMVRVDNFTSYADILEGSITEGRLEVSNVGTDTPWTVYDNTYYSREVFHDIARDSFDVDREISTDGGKTWALGARFHYRRADHR